MAERAESDPAAEARALVGSRLDELHGTPIGRIDGVLVDAGDGTPTWLVVRTGRFGRHAPVPCDCVASGSGRAWAPHPRDIIRAAAEIDPADGLSCGDERELAFHFGIPPGAERLTAIAGRGDDERGSVPG